MIEVYLTGGLGNQIFQFASAYAAAKSKNVKLTLNLTWFQAISGMKSVTKRKFDLSYAVNPSVTIIQPSTLISIALAKKNFKLGRLKAKLNGYSLFVENDPFEYDSRIKSVSDKTLLLGNFQSEQYFKPYRAELKELLSVTGNTSPDYIDLKKCISLPNTLCVHIRRGDYITNSDAFNTHGVPEISYYSNALSHFLKKYKELKIFVFSDDQQWTRSQAFWPRNTMFVDDRNYSSSEIMNLISQSQHHILSNSTFGWWAAWIKEQQGEVILPKYWLRDRLTQNTGLVAENWQVFDSNGPISAECGAATSTNNDD